MCFQTASSRIVRARRSQSRSHHAYEPWSMPIGHTNGREARYACALKSDEQRHGACKVGETTVSCDDIERWATRLVGIRDECRHALKHWNVSARGLYGFGEALNLKSECERLLRRLLTPGARQMP